MFNQSLNPAPTLLLFQRMQKANAPKNPKSSNTMLIASSKCWSDPRIFGTFCQIWNPFLQWIFQSTIQNKLQISSHQNSISFDQTFPGFFPIYVCCPFCKSLFHYFTFENFIIPVLYHLIWSYSSTLKQTFEPSIFAMSEFKTTFWTIPNSCFQVLKQTVESSIIAISKFETAFEPYKSPDSSFWIASWTMQTSRFKFWHEALNFHNCNFWVWNNLWKCIISQVLILKQPFNHTVSQFFKFWKKKPL